MLSKLNESIWLASAETTLPLARPPFEPDQITRFYTDTAQPQRSKAQAYTAEHNKQQLRRSNSAFPIELGLQASSDGSSIMESGILAV